MTSEPQPLLRTRPQGPLRNGNPRGNPNLAPRCGARTRLGVACRSPAMANHRCRMHGGRSTGPRTEQGLARLRAARTVHGLYSAETKQYLFAVKALLVQSETLRGLVAANAPEERIEALFSPLPPRWAWVEGGKNPMHRGTPHAGAPPHPRRRRTRQDRTPCTVTRAGSPGAAGTAATPADGPLSCPALACATATPAHPALAVSAAHGGAGSATPHPEWRPTTPAPPPDPAAFAASGTRKTPCTVRGAVPVPAVGQAPPCPAAAPAPDWLASPRTDRGKTPCTVSPLHTPDGFGHAAEPPAQETGASLPGATVYGKTPCTVGPPHAPDRSGHAGEPLAQGTGLAFPTQPHTEKPMHRESTDHPKDRKTGSKPSSCDVRTTPRLRAAHSTV